MDDLFVGLHTEGGKQVSIVVDGMASELIAAVPGFKNYDVEIATGMVVSHQSHDWIMPVSAWPRPPKRGDKIVSAGDVYEVSFPGGGRQYEFVDQYEVLYRIHTVEVHA